MIRETTQCRPRINSVAGCSVKVAIAMAAVVVCLATADRVKAAGPPLDFESEPINYSHATPDNAVSRLQAAIDSGDKSLTFQEQFGYLRAVLQELDVPESTQMLTFLKSSLQRPLIGPQNARALYFGDDAYVGYVPDGMLELIVADEKLGMVFYTLEQDPQGPRFERQVARCMTCHSSSRTKNIPGLQVRSMLTDPDGEPVLSAGSFRTDHSSPFEKRWGGWFVSGTHGDARHLGNFHLPDKKRPQQPVANDAGANVTDLGPLTDLSKHLTPHSDLVALMVFEHQIDAHNLMVRTNYAWQIAEFHGNAASEDSHWKQEADALVNHLLFTTELQFDQPVQGTSVFAQQFAARGSSPGKGILLREFDLQTRLFKSSVSYTVESAFFRTLPTSVRRYVTEQIENRLRKPRDSSQVGGVGHQDLIEQLPELLLSGDEQTESAP
ncbi:MAG: hypothetical protein KDA66_13540 [Planctomycetaceae bacterium]|nr:hypothetical protein [Planctomycetaceae bacterium]